MDNVLSEQEKKYVEKINSLDFLNFLFNTINPNEMEQYISMYLSSGEKDIKMNGKQKPKDPIIMPDEEYDTPVVHASCPVCGSGLGHDISDHKANHISYCETCGQAIRWGGVVRDKATS